PRTTPTPAAAANRFRLRTRSRSRGLLPRHPGGNRLRRTTGTTGAPLSSSLPAPTVLCLRLVAGDGSEQRLDRGLHFLLNHVPDDRHEASLSRHRVLLAGARYTKARSPAKSAAQRPEW